MAMGMGPQAGHDVFVRVPDDESCCTFGQCTITYYVVFTILSALACVLALMVLFSGLEWMGWLVTDLIILVILWGTFCCVYGCRRRRLAQSPNSGANRSDPVIGVQLAYSAGAPAGGNVQQGYPVTGIVHQGYPVTHHPAPAPSWPTPSVPPGPKADYHGSYPAPFPQSHAGSSS